MFLKGKRGFTLIEILVVVSIVGLLSSVFIVGLGGFRARGRDARRLADIKQMQNGLELYYTGNSSYPAVASWEELETALAGPGAGLGITKIPNDPQSAAGKTYEYAASDDGQSYVLKATLENLGDPSLNEDVDASEDSLGLDCADPAYCVKF